MSTLDEIMDGSRNRRRGCIVCGDDLVAAVSIDIRKVDGAGRILTKEKGGKTRSRSGSFCERHAAELWTRLLSQMDEL